MLAVLEDSSEVKDIDSIIDLVILGIGESKYPTGAIDLSKVPAFVISCIDNEDCCVLVLYHEEEPVGILVGSEVKGHPYLKDSMLCIENFWYVKEDYRKKVKGADLLRVFEMWTEYKNCSHCIVASQGADSRVDKVYNRKGFAKVESVFVKEI